MKLTIVSDNRVLAEQFHMKSGSYSSCQLFFPFILLIIIPLPHHCVQCMWVQAPFALGSVLMGRVGVIKIVIVINCNLITFFKIIENNCNSVFTLITIIEM